MSVKGLKIRSVGRFPASLCSPNGRQSAALYGHLNGFYRRQPANSRRSVAHSKTRRLRHTYRARNRPKMPAVPPVGKVTFLSFRNRGRRPSKSKPAVGRPISNKLRIVRRKNITVRLQFFKPRIIRRLANRLAPQLPGNRPTMRTTSAADGPHSPRRTQ